MNKNEPILFMGSAGALLSDRAIPGLTQTLTKDAASFYGSAHFICETIEIGAARIIAEALGYCLLESKLYINEDGSDA